MPPHSFLLRPVTNTSELVDEVARDPRVLDRYERHFAMTGDEVIAYLRTLHVARNSKDRWMNIYLVRENGSLDVRYQLLKAGKKIFVDDSGKGILVLACGNPMVPPKNPPFEFDQPQTQNNESVNVVPIATGATPSPESVAQLTLAMPALADVPTVAETATQPIQPQPNKAPQPILGAIASVIPVGILPLVGGSRGHSGPPSQATPEPASMIALAIGGAGLVASKRRKAR